MRRLLFPTLVSVSAAVAGLMLGSSLFTTRLAAAEDSVGEAAELGAEDFADAERSLLWTLSPLPAPSVDTTNKYADSPAAASLGHRLFFDKRIAGPIQAGTAAEGQLGAIGETKKIACADCHMPASKWLFDIRSHNGGAIPNATSLGSMWMTRNVSSIVNTVFYQQAPGGRDAAHWRENDGYSDSEWFDAQSEPEGAQVQNGSRLQLAHLIYDKYAADYAAAFPDWPIDRGLADTRRFPPTGLPGQPAFDGMAAGDKVIVNRILANYGKAIEAYLRTLVSRNAPFDRYVAGDHGAISSSAKRGYRLFVGKAGCIKCHNGPLFSDDSFHVIGLHIDTTRSPHADPAETGRAANQTLICGSEFNVNGPYSDDRGTRRLAGFCAAPIVTLAPGAWRTKGLRQVAETAPYMRDGQFATLEEVIDFYDRGGDPAGSFLGGPKELAPLHLSSSEKKELVAFLKTLTGEALPAALIADTHRP